MIQSTTTLVRVIVVDDSAFARKVVREVLVGSPQIDVVGTARDGAEALELVATMAPDLVICDLRMPRMDGVTFVREQMKARPLPILILSAAEEDAAEVVDALSAGAVAVVRKPTALATDELRSVREELVTMVCAAVGTPFTRTAPVIPPAPAAAAPTASAERESKRPRSPAIVLIGISTGGPQALRRLVPALPKDFAVPIGIVLHMPVGYTALYAEKLNEICGLEVKEAEEGDLFQPGRVLLAPAGRHMLVSLSPSGNLVAKLSMAPIDKLHRPSVDVMFRSAAEALGDRVLAVVMTGMGDDGKEGAAWVKAQGGTVLTEAEQSCVIYGMPRSVAEAGLSDAAVPLDAMAAAIISRL